MRSSPALLRRSAPAWLALTLSLCLAACSTLQPQVLSPRFAPERIQQDQLQCAELASRMTPASGRVALPLALCEARGLQASYMDTVRNLSGASSGSSAALIGLTSLAVLKGITHPTSRDLAGLGVVGSGVYAYGSTMISRPRQVVYLAGADALECAVAASAPYDLPDGWVRDVPATAPASRAADGAAAGRQPAAWAPEPDNLVRRMALAKKARDDLDTALSALRPLERTVQKSVTPAFRPAAACDGAAAVEPPALSDGASADDKRLNEIRRSRASALRQRCTPPAPYIETTTPHPDVASTRRDLQRTAAAIDRQLRVAHQQIGIIDQAGQNLRSRALIIETQVAREVLKTEPDITAVRAAAQNLRAGAFALSGAPSLEQAPAAAAAADGASMPKTAGTSDTGAHNAAAPRTRVAERPDEVLNDAKARLVAARTQLDRLNDWLAELKQRVDAASTRLESCGSGGAIAAPTLNVLPAEAEIEVAADATQEFLVSGGSGVPTGSVLSQAAGGKSRALPAATLEGGRFKLVYAPPKDAKDGTREIVSLVDGAGLLHHTVTVVVHAAAEKP